MKINSEELESLASQARVPVATYRLQFNRQFTFDHARELAEYLRDLGISDLYASPLFQAGPESTHGYDICSFDQLSPALGGRVRFRALTERLRELGMGLLLDMVPNHMGSDLSNPWWRDVLGHGRQSEFAQFFDVDWQPARSDLRDKVLLPILGDRYATVLEAGQLQLSCADSGIAIRYFDRSLPLAPLSCARLLEQSAELVEKGHGQDALVEELRQFAERLRASGASVCQLHEQLTRWREASPQFAKALETLCAWYNGQPGNPRSFDKLHEMLQEQQYRLAFWRVGPEEINYRRFFDVAQLVSLRMEAPEVFRATHQLLLELIRAGEVTGLRIDHPDGLRDPKEYFERLQAAYILAQRQPAERSDAVSSEAISRWIAARLAPLERQASHHPVDQGMGHTLDAPRSDPEGGKSPRQNWPLYVVVEKILSGDEPLRPDWPVDGTTGYDFLIALNGVFVKRENEEAFDRLNGEFSGNAQGFMDAVYAGKKWILRHSLISELNALAARLKLVASRTRYGQDYTFGQLHRALEEVLANFPVYRTYATRSSRELVPIERAYVERAIAAAKARCQEFERAIFDFIQDLLLLRAPPDLDAEARELSQEFVLRFQQLSGPATAKGLEDTAFYNYNRLISLNEVGGEPGRFGTSVDEFHQHNLLKAERWPNSLLATATHDTKRGEDVRARINVLSEMPDDWREAIQRWHDLNADQRTSVDGEPAPHPNDEYLLYQTLVGAWPAARPSLASSDADPQAAGAEDAALSEFPERTAAYMLKAMREGKTRTTWTDPNEPYERAVQDFVRRILDPGASGAFLEDFRAFQRRVAFFGQFNSFSQVLLKLAAPGVPDFYQGTELWDFNLVDPDNRRPVDYQRRRELLARVRSGSTGLLDALSGRTYTGELKLYITHRGLQFRAANQDLFRRGAYQPVQATGPKRGHVCAFARKWQDRMVLVVAPRQVFGLVNGETRPPLGESAWHDTALKLQDATFSGTYENVFTGQRICAAPGKTGANLPLAAVLSTLPVALLTRVGE